MKLLFILLSALSSFLTYLDSHILHSDFTITVAQNVSQPLTYRGTYTMQGNCFGLALLDFEASYDGKTFYLYRDEDKEITLSTPTADELCQTNPMLYAKALQSACNITERESDGVYTATLTPKNKEAGIQRFVVRWKGHLPVSIEMREGQQTTTLTFIKPEYIATAPSFSIHKDGAYINDLR